MPVKRPNTAEGKYATHPCVVQVELFEESMIKFNSILSSHEDHLTRVSHLVADEMKNLKAVIRDLTRRLNNLENLMKTIKRDTRETRRLVKENGETDED